MTLIPGAYVTAEDAEPYPYRHTLRSDGPGRVILLVAPPTDDNAAHTYAIVSRVVTGWRCLAVGGAVAESFAAVSEAIGQHYGTGHDYLPREQFALTEPDKLDIHVQRTVGEPATYCNTNAPNPYVYKRTSTSSTASRAAPTTRLRTSAVTPSRSTDHADPQGTPGHVHRHQCPD